jgi:hypothetical protein
VTNSIPSTPLPNIIRSGDLTYEYETTKMANWRKFNKADDKNKLKAKIRIELPEKSQKHLSYMKGLTQRIIKHAEQNNEVLTSTVYKDKNTGRKWKIVKTSSTLKKLGRFLGRQNLLKFIHTTDSPGIETYELKRHWTLWDFFLEIYLFFFHKYDTPDYSIDYDSRDKSKDSGLNDPFTELASRAYQDLEHDFVCHDGKKAGDFTSDYIMIHQDGNLKLVHKSQKNKYKTEAKDALELCWKHYRNEYGKEKMEYAQYLAKFSFLKMDSSFEEEDFQALTPEHIYRMNILTSGVEHQDIQSLACKMQWLNTRLVDKDEGKTLESVFNELLENKSTTWSNREIRNFVSCLAKANEKNPKDVTIADLRNYVDGLDLKWNLHSQLQFTRSVILSVGSRRYSSLEDLLDNHPDMKDVWSDEEKAHLLDFVKAHTGKDNPQPNEFLEAHQLMQHLVNEATSIKGDEAETSLNKWLKGQLGNIQGNKKHNSQLADYLCRIMKLENANVSDFTGCFEDTTFQITTEQYNQLANVYKRKPKELEKAYTGRKIIRTLDSAYTYADRDFYKPWVDMQEFLQSCDELKDDTLKDPYTGKVRTLSQKEKQRRFDEVAVFMFCKKHLFRPHPREGYRVGELIPAPSDENGNKRWYRVSRMIASHDGLMSYVLEPLGKDSELQTCVVSRSTAGSPYAYEAGATYKNDANPIQDPGYLGRRHTDKYLDPVRNAHTIPAWVAYQHAAKNSLEGDSSDLSYEHLTRSVEELQKEVHFKHHKKNFHELVQEFDAEINDLMAKRVGLRRWFNSLWFLKYTPLVFLQMIFRHATKDVDSLMKVVMREAHERSRQKVEDETATEANKRIAQERKDAQKLLRYIKKYAPKDSKGKLDSNYQDLVNAIGDNLYRNNDGAVDDKYKKILKSHGYDVKRSGWYKEYSDAEKEIEEVIANCNEFANAYNEAPSATILNQWEAYLHRHAQSMGENVESKSTKGLRFSGHSLGGSAAEVETYLATAGSNRMPVPGSTVHASLYDDPGMAEEDNVSQYQFMLNHLNVMESLNINMSVYHSHEYGDIIPLGGTAHLGGITPAVTKKIKKYIFTHNVMESEAFLNWIDTKKISRDEITEKHAEAFILDRLDQTLFSVTELKKATSYALEAEIADYPVKHGTRFESARREQTWLLEISNAVGTKKLNVDLDKNLGVLNNYLMHIFSDDDQQFKDEYPHMYTDKVACVKKFDLVNAQEFLEIQDKVSLGGRLTPEEFQRHNELKKLGLGKVYAHADRLRQQQQMLKAISFFESNDAEETIRDIIKLINSLDRKDSFKQENAKKILFSSYKNHLLIIRELYHQQLNREADTVRARAVGGMRVTWLSRSELGEISGRGIQDDKQVSKRCGFGAFTSGGVDKLRKSVGSIFLPAFMPEIYNEKKLLKQTRKQGHGVSIFHRNRKSRALVIDEFGGPLVGIR